MSGHATRADARQNRRALLAAVARLLRAGAPFTLTELAAEARVSRATTYRNFSSPDAAVEAYIHDFLDDFEARCAADPAIASGEPGSAALVAICRAWTELIAERSHALAHARSAEGFLARARSDDPIIGRVYRVVRPAVDRAIAAGELTAADPDLVVFLWNLLFDPRELIDLAEHRGVSVERAGAGLVAVLFAAVNGSVP